MYMASKTDNNNNDVDEELLQLVAKYRAQKKGRSR